MWVKRKLKSVLKEPRSQWRGAKTEAICSHVLVSVKSLAAEFWTRWSWMNQLLCIVFYHPLAAFLRWKSLDPIFQYGPQSWYQVQNTSDLVFSEIQLQLSRPVQMFISVYIHGERESTSIASAVLHVILFNLTSLESFLQHVDTVITFPVYKIQPPHIVIMCACKTSHCVSVTLGQKILYSGWPLKTLSCIKQVMPFFWCHILVNLRTNSISLSVCFGVRFWRQARGISPEESFLSQHVVECFYDLIISSWWARV